MTVTTTTKTLNYSINKGNDPNLVNSVNATITSTPGFNRNYLGKLPGILKILELIFAVISLGLVASQRQEHRPIISDPTNTTNPLPNVPWFSYLREQFLVGEVFFLCAHSAVITLLVVVLISYLFHTVSAMITPKVTTLENVFNIILPMLLFTAGILEIIQTVDWEKDDHGRRIMDGEGIRIAAGVMALLNGLMFLASFLLSRKELAGPKNLK